MTDYINVVMVQDCVRNADTPLHLAAMHGQTSMCEFLVQQQADVKAVNGNHKTPLLLVTEREVRGTVELLLKIEKMSRADPKKSQETSGRKEESESETEAEIGASTSDERPLWTAPLTTSGARI